MIYVATYEGQADRGAKNENKISTRRLQSSNGGKQMRACSVSTVIALGVMLLGLPMFADTFAVIPQCTAGYVSMTTTYPPTGPDYTVTSTDGPFTFSNPQTELTVPTTWSTWGSPPFTCSSDPRVFYNKGFSTLTITISPGAGIVGFELEPRLFQEETVSATFYDGIVVVGTITLAVNGDGGALLFAAQTNGTFTSVVIDDLSGDDFAIDPRWGPSSAGSTPEPGTIVLLGSGLLSGLGLMCRKINSSPAKP